MFVVNGPVQIKVNLFCGQVKLMQNSRRNAVLLHMKNVLCD